MTIPQKTILVAILMSLFGVANLVAQTEADLSAFDELRLHRFPEDTPLQVELEHNQAIVDMAIELFGNGDHRTANAKGKLGFAHFRAGDHEQAEALYREDIRVQLELRESGRLYPLGLIVTYANLAMLLQEEERLEEAADSYWAAIEIEKDFGGRINTLYQGHLLSYASIVSEIYPANEAEPIIREVIALLSKARPLDTFMASVHENMASVLLDMGKLEEAESYAMLALENGRLVIGRIDKSAMEPDWLILIYESFVSRLDMVAAIHFAQGEREEAILFSNEAVSNLHELLSGDHPRAIDIEARLTKISRQ